MGSYSVRVRGGLRRSTLPELYPCPLSPVDGLKELAMDRGERCPKCESAMLSSDLDGDLSCLICGAVIYVRLPMTAAEARLDREGRVKVAR